MVESVNSSEKIRLLESHERALRIIRSRTISVLRALNSPKGLEEALGSDELSRNEKDYMLFNLERVLKISGFSYADFERKMKAFLDKDGCQRR